MSESSSAPRTGLALAGFIILTFCAPLFGAAAMPGVWYAALQKPTWNPPPWIFGPAWTLLYTLMAVAAWLVWKQVGWRRPLLLYFIQLALNAAWTPIFFGAYPRSPREMMDGWIYLPRCSQGSGFRQSVVRACP